MKKSTFLAAFIASASLMTASAATADYVLTPAAGPATDLMKIELNFPNDYVVFYENTRMPAATLENVTTGAVYYCQEADRNTYAEAKTGYTLVFIGEDNTEAIPVNEPGEYTLTVRGMYLTDDTDAVVEELDPITASYTITYPVAYTLTPDPASQVTDLAKITLDFTSAKNVEFYENSRTPAVVLENLTTGKAYVCAEPTRNTFALTDGIAYEFQFTLEGEDEAEPVISEPGEYVLTVKGIALNNEGEYEDLPIIKAYYQIVFPVAYTLTPDPATPATDLMTIGLEFPENNNVAFYENSNMPVAVLENLENGKIYNCQEASRNTFAATEGIAYELTFVDEDGEEAGPITEPGTYRLTVRAMGLTENDELTESLPVLMATYTINYPVDYLIYPLGSVASNLKTVTIEFPNNKVDFYTGGMAVAVLEDLASGKVYECREPDIDTNAETNPEGCVYNLTFIDYDTDEEFPEALDITTPGEYLLTIRAAKYLDGIDEATEEENWIDLPVITKGYTINYPYTYTLDPEAGTEVKDLTTIILEFPDDPYIRFYENSPMPVVRLTNNDTEEVYTCAEPDRDVFAMGSSRFTLVFNDEEGDMAIINKAGSYTLTISGLYRQDATITDDDEVIEGEIVDLPVIYADYTVGYFTDYELDPVSGSTVEDLQQITLTFPENSNVRFYENNNMAVAVLENTNTGVAYVCQEASRNTFAQTDGVQYILTFIEEGLEEVAPIVAEGFYTLTVKALCIVDEDNQPIMDLPVITATYIIAESGVKAAEMIGADSFNVYTINGVKVVSNGDARSLDTLGSGLYIINGKKVLIRK